MEQAANKVAASEKGNDREQHECASENSESGDWKQITKKQQTVGQPEKRREANGPKVQNPGPALNNSTEHVEENETEADERRVQIARKRWCA